MYGKCKTHFVIGCILFFLVYKKEKNSHQSSDLARIFHQTQRVGCRWIFLLLVMGSRQRRQKPYKNIFIELLIYPHEKKNTQQQQPTCSFVSTELINLLAKILKATPVARQVGFSALLLAYYAEVPRAPWKVWKLKFIHFCITLITVYCMGNLTANVCFCFFV